MSMKNTQFIEEMKSIGNFGNPVMANKTVFNAILSNKFGKITVGAFKSLH